MNAIETSALSRMYGRLKALDDVSLQIPEGSITGLVGPNGAGKTTLFSIICGFIKPTKGTVTVMGQPARSKATSRGTLAVLPQDAKFLKGLPIRHHFLYYAHLLGLGKEEAKKDVQRVLDLVDLSQHAGREGDKLSHGMHKRMGIAQALLGNPRLVLLDEPTAGLDPENAMKVRQTIRESKGSRTIVVSSHNLAEIEDVCDYIAVLSKGTLIAQDSMESFTNRQSRVTFTLTVPLDEGVEASLEGVVSGVASVHVDEERRKLTFFVEGEGSAIDELIVELLKLLISKSIHFNEMTKGSALEDRFLEVVKS